MRRILFFLSYLTAAAVAGEPAKDKGMEAKNDRGKANREKLASVIIPELEFIELTLPEAIAELDDLIRKNDPDKKGIPFKVELVGEPLINLILREVPAYDALNFTTQLAGSDFIIKSTGVEVGNMVALGLETKVFRMPEKLAAKMQKSTSVEAFWEALGVSLEDGSLISYLDADLRAIHQPQSNLRLIQKRIDRALAEGDVLMKSSIEKKVESTVIPKLQLVNVRLDEAVKKLRVAGKVDIFVQLADFDAEFPLVTLEMEDATLKEAIESAAKQSGMQVVYDTWIVVLRPKD